MWPNVGAPRTMAAVIQWTWVGPGSHPGSSTVQNASSSTPAGSITTTATSTIRSRDAENPVVSTSMTANPDRKVSPSFIATTVDRGCDGGRTLVAYRIGVGSATHRRGFRHAGLGAPSRSESTGIRYFPTGALSRG